MKWLLAVLAWAVICLGVLHAVDREIARQEYLSHKKAPVLERITGCIFPENCVYYNVLLKEGK